MIDRLVSYSSSTSLTKPLSISSSNALNRPGYESWVRPFYLASP